MTVHFPRNAERFEFDAEVAEIFDDMAARSLPGYDYVYHRITDIVSRMSVPHYSQVWDFGTSTGMGLKAVQRGAKHPYVHYLGCDISDPMVKKAAGLPWAKIITHDLTTGLPADVASGKVAVAIFGWTLQFLENRVLRERLITEAYRALMPGGWLFVMEKFSDTTEFGDTMQDAYIAWRRDNGYSLEEIEAKSMALRGAMFPWHETSLLAAVQRASGGLADCRVLFRLFNFGGYAVQKPVV